MYGMPVCVLTTWLAAGVTAKAVIADIEPDTFELVLGWMYGTIDSAYGYAKKLSCMWPATGLA